VNWLFQRCDVSINEINVSATFMSFAIHSKNGRQKVNTSNTASFLSKVLGETSETFTVRMTLKGGTPAISGVVSGTTVRALVLGRLSPKKSYKQN